MPSPRMVEIGSYLFKPPNTVYVDLSVHGRLLLKISLHDSVYDIIQKYKENENLHKLAVEPQKQLKEMKNLYVSGEIIWRLFTTKSLNT